MDRIRKLEIEVSKLKREVKDLKEQNDGSKWWWVVIFLLAFYIGWNLF